MILEPSLTDDGRIVSYSIRTDSGYDMLRHHSFLRLSVEKQLGKPTKTAIPDILENEVRAQPGKAELTQTDHSRVTPERAARQPVKLDL